MESKRKKVSWADLPIEVLQPIAQLLPSKATKLRFRAVCKNWWRSTTLFPFLPRITDHHEPPQRLFSSSIFLIRPHGSSHRTPWIVSLVELTKHKFQLLQPFLETSLENVPVKLDLTQFQTFRLTKTYHMADVGEHDCSSAVCCYNKVLVLPDQFVSSFDECDLYALDNWGRLLGSPKFSNPFYRCEEEDDRKKRTFVPWRLISYPTVNRFDDIVSFIGFVKVVDRQGKLYDHSFSVTERFRCINNVPLVSEEGLNQGWRKRLVVSPDGNKLYLITRELQMLKVYHFSKPCAKGLDCWVEIQKFQDDDQVLFLSTGYSFFASAAQFPGCELSNCIIFSYDAFPSCLILGWNFPRFLVEEKIQIFKMGGHDAFKSISTYSGFPMNLWSVPPWVLQAQPSSLESLPQREMEHKRMEVIEHGSTGCPPKDSCNILTVQNHATTNDVQDVAEEEETICSVTSSDIIQDSKDTSTVKFKGINIRSSLHPTLLRIWSRHGNIVDKTIIYNGDIIARALESLAIVALILESNTGQSLNDRQADYFSSTLSELRHMRINIDWLAPAVEKALALHKSKPMFEPLNNLLEAKARAAETRSKLIEELDLVEKELDEDIAMARRMIPFSEVDLEQSLGTGKLMPDCETIRCY